MDVLTITSFVLFTGLVAAITVLLTRHDDHSTADGYFLAGRSLTGGFVAGSLLLTNLSTEQLVGLNGLAYKDGLSVMAWEVIAGLSLVAMALLFLPKFLRAGVTTVPQYLEQRFDKQTRLLVSSIFIVAYALILLPTLLYTGARGLNGMLNVKEVVGLGTDTGAIWFTVWLVGSIGSMYAIFGGLRTVAVSDTINGIGLLIGGLLISLLGLRAVSQEAVGVNSVVEGWRVLRQQHPEMFNSLGSSEQSVPLSTLFSGVLLINLFYWCSNQQILQRALAARSLAEGQKGVLLASTFKLLAPIVLVLPGIVAFHLYADEGIAADDAYGRLVGDVLPPQLTGFFAAAIAGAILSSYNSVLNSTATLFSLGIYQAHIRPHATSQELIRVGKYCAAVLAIAAMLTAPLLANTTNIFDYLQKMNGIYFIPVFSVVVIGMGTRRLPPAAAKAGLVSGIVAIAFGYFVFPSVVARLHEYHFVGIVFACLITLMLVWGKLRPLSTPAELPHGGSIDLTPWRLATPYALVVLLAVVGIYLMFADFGAP